MRIVVCIFLLALAACRTGPAPATFTPTSLSLKVDQQQQLGGLQLTLSEVRESRCPMNARCLRAGEAIAVIQVVQPSRARNIQLCSGSDCNRAGLSDTYTLTDGDLKYQFRLDSITPDPGKTLAHKEKQVYFTVSQLK